VVRCLILQSFGDLSERAECSTLAYGRRMDQSFNRYRSGVVSIVEIATHPFSEEGSRSGLDLGLCLFRAIRRGCDPALRKARRNRPA